MVDSLYIPEEGDAVWLDFSPQAGHEQDGRRPGFVITPKTYNRIGLALICPVTNQKKGYPFEVPIPAFGGNTTGVILADQLRSLDWQTRNASFKEKLPQAVLDEVKSKLSLLLQIDKD
jgi:mRNA interferase MazF